MPKALTQAQSVSGELPFAAVVGEAVALLVKRHFLRIHYDGQVSRFNVGGIRLKTGSGKIIHRIYPAVLRGEGCRLQDGVPAGECRGFQPQP